MMARFPAPMASWGRTLPSVVDTILSALAPILPDRIPAAHLGVLGGTVVFFGVDPATGQRFVTQSIEGGGWGGRPYEDGESASRVRLPGRRAQRADREDGAPLADRRRTAARCVAIPAGAGSFRGGLGLEVEVAGPGRRIVDARPTPGGIGSRRGASSAAFAGSPSDSLRAAAGRAGVQPRRLRPPRACRPGTTAVVVTAGGGGWGDPLDRDPASVARRRASKNTCRSTPRAISTASCSSRTHSTWIARRRLVVAPTSRAAREAVRRVKPVTTLAEFVQSPDLAAIAAARFDRVKQHIVDTCGAQHGRIADRRGCRRRSARGRYRRPVVALVVRCAQARCTEIDDIHLTSCTTPGSVIVPTALGARGSRRSATRWESSARRSLAGYEALIRLGVAIDGPAALHKGVWPTACRGRVRQRRGHRRAYGLSVERTAGALATVARVVTGADAGIRRRLVAMDHARRRCGERRARGARARTPACTAPTRTDALFAG